MAGGRQWKVGILDLGTTSVQTLSCHDLVGLRKKTSVAGGRYEGGEEKFVEHENCLGPNLGLCKAESCGP